MQQSRLMIIIFNYIPILFMIVILIKCIILTICYLKVFFYKFMFFTNKIKWIKDFLRFKTYFLFNLFMGDDYDYIHL